MISLYICSIYPSRRQLLTSLYKYVIRVNLDLHCLQKKTFSQKLAVLKSSYSLTSNWKLIYLFYVYDSGRNLSKHTRKWNIMWLISEYFRAKLVSADVLSYLDLHWSQMPFGCFSQIVAQMSRIGIRHLMRVNWSYVSRLLPTFRIIRVRRKRKGNIFISHVWTLGRN